MLVPDTLLQQRYQVVRLIGQGGMGAVYEALDQRLGITVALKQTLASSGQAGRAFEREARLLAGLRHPSLPKVIDHFVDDSGRFLVMEFIPGEDLGTVLERREAPFPVADVLRWGDQLLGVLEYLHSREPPILHRDIKPQNLKLTPEGVPVLLDFGLAKGAHTLQSQLSTSGSVFGYTPHYAPIEQIHNSGTDQRSDLYALAATLYHLLTGTRPLDALSRATAILRRQPDPLRSPTELNPHVPRAVSAVLVQALALNQEERPASAAEMRAALAAAIRAPEPQPYDPDAPTVAAPGSGAVSVAAAAPSGPAKGAVPARAQAPAALASLAALLERARRQVPPLAATYVAQPLGRARRTLEPLVAAHISPLLQRARGVPWLLPSVGGAALLLALLLFAMNVASGGRETAAAPTAIAATTGPTSAPAQRTPTANITAQARPRGTTVSGLSTTAVRDRPGASSVEPSESYAGVLPLALTVRGRALDSVQKFQLVAPNGAAVVPDVRSVTSGEALLVVTELPGPLDGEAEFTLALDGERQPVGVVLRDYRERRLLQGVQADYSYTGRVRSDASGPFTQMLAEPDASSKPVAVLRNGDEVDLLRDDRPGWYQIRLRIVGQTTQFSVVGWVERWLVDNRDVPEPTVFSGILGKTPTDGAVRCGTRFSSSVYGSVERPDGSGIGGAVVRVTSSDGRNSFTQRTRSDGTYTVGGLGCTTWIVELIEVPGLAGFKANAVTVRNLNGGQYTAAEVRFHQQP